LKLHRAIVADRSDSNIKARQDGNPPEVIAYADKANERLRRKYYHMVLKNNKKTNVAKTAVAGNLLVSCGA
jgi:transposase